MSDKPAPLPIRKPGTQYPGSSTYRRPAPEPAPQGDPK